MRLSLLLTASVLIMAPGSLSAQAPDTLNIGLLVDERRPELDPLADSLYTEIRGVLGSSVASTFPFGGIRSSDFDAAATLAEYDDLVAEGADVVLAFGPVVSSALFDRLSHPVPTVVFGNVNADLQQFSDQEVSGRENFTFVLTSQSYAADLRMLDRTVDFSRVGVAVRASYLSVLPIESALREAAAAVGAEVAMIPYRTVDDIIAGLEGLDAFYLADAPNLLPREVQRLADELRARGIPSMSGARRQDVELGFMISNRAGENIQRLLRRVALHVEAVARGVDLADRPVRVDLEERLSVNFTTAEIVNVPIASALLVDADFMGDFANPLSEQTYTLASVVDEAVLGNLFLESARRNVDLADQDTRAAWSAYLPTVVAGGSGTATDPDLAEASLGLNPQYEGAAAVSLNQTIFSYQAIANISVTNKLLDAQRESLRATELDLILESGNAFLTAQLLKSTREIRKLDVDATTRHLLIAERSFTAGQSGRADVLRLQAERARDLQALVEAAAQVDQSLQAINRLLNRPIDREIDVIETEMEGLSPNGEEPLLAVLEDPRQLDDFDDFLIAEAIAFAPEITQLDFNLAATQEIIDLNGVRRFIPTVAGTAEYNWILGRGGLGVPTENTPGAAVTDFYRLGLTASIPLFESNLRNIDRQVAKLQYDQLRIGREDTSRAIELGVQDVLIVLTREARNIRLTEIGVQAAFEGLQLVETGYANGAVTVVELVDARTNLLRARLSQANALYNYRVGLLSLGRLVGHFVGLSTEAENQAFFDDFERYQRTLEEGR